VCYHTWFLGTFFLVFTGFLLAARSLFAAFSCTCPCTEVEVFSPSSPRVSRDPPSTGVFGDVQGQALSPDVSSLGAAVVTCAAFMVVRGRNNNNFKTKKKKKKTHKQKEDNLHFTNAGVEEKLARRKKALSLWP
jgi:hypothetical protein